MSKVVITDQPTVTVNGTNLSSHVAALTVEVTAEEKDATAFGSKYRQPMLGLRSGSVTISFHTDYASGSVNATLGALFSAGTNGTVVASGSFGGETVAGTAVCLITSLTPFGGAVGDLMTQDVTWPTVGTVTGFGL